MEDTLEDTLEGRAERQGSAGTLDQRVYMWLQHAGLWVGDFYHGGRLPRMAPQESRGKLVTFYTLNSKIPAPLPYCRSQSSHVSTYIEGEQ